MLPETNVNNAKFIAERLRENVSRADLGVIDGKQLPNVTISLGISTRAPNDTLDMLIAAADVAMYHAKQKGRNRVEVSTNASIVNK